MPHSVASFQSALAAALSARAALLDPRHETARRLFNGFYEGRPALSADLYGKTLVLHNYADPPADLVQVPRRGILWCPRRLAHCL